MKKNINVFSRSWSNNLLLCLTTSIFAVSVAFSSAQAQEISASNPASILRSSSKPLQKSIYLELLGNGGFGSVNYETEIAENTLFCVGIGGMISPDIAMEPKIPDITNQIANIVKHLNREQTQLYSRTDYWIRFRCRLHRCSHAMMREMPLKLADF